MRPIVRILLSAVVCLVAAASFAQTGSPYRCGAESVTAHESDGVLRVPLERFGDTSAASSGTLTIFGSTTTTWNLPTGVKTIHFAPGETLKTFDIALQDSFYTGFQQTTVRCGENIAGNTARMRLIVIDDESLPILTAPDNLVITETDSTQSIDLVLTVNTPFGEDGAWITVNTRDLGTSDADYILSRREFPFPGFETTVLYRVQILGDLQAEPDEQVILELSSVMGTRRIPITIIDDDRPPYELTLDRASYDFREGEPALVTVTRSGVTSGAVNAILRMQPKDANQWPTEIPLAFAPGETSKTVELALDDDWFTEMRIGTLQLLTDGYLADSAEITIVDDDPMPVLSILDGETIEGAAGQITKLNLTLTLSAPVGFDLNATISTANRTAIGDDYVPVTQKRVTFIAGELSRTVSIDIRGDGDVEPDEQFSVSLTNCCPQWATVLKGMAIATIRDDDLAPGALTHRFDNAEAISINESQKWLETAVIRGGDISAPSTVTLPLNLGITRTIAPVALRFRAHERKKNVRIYIDDTHFTGPANGTLQLLVNGTSMQQRNVAIVDDETRPMISVADIDVTEGANDRIEQIEVTIHPPTHLALDFDVQIMSATGDLKNAPTHITIPPQKSRFTFPVTIVGDAKAEETEAFSVKLLPPPSGPFWFDSDLEAICTIHDDDRAARMTTASDRIRRGTEVALTIELGATAATAMALQPATDATNVLALPATIEIPAGASTATFVATVIGVGPANVRVVLPRSHGSAILEMPLFAYDIAVADVSPQSLKLKQGSTATIGVSLLPAVSEVQMSVTSLAPSIAAVDPVVVIPPGANATIVVYGASIGKTKLTLTLPVEYGGASLLVPIEVTEVVAGRQRATRH